ncbi:MAG: FGGY-family carbohydrate kinase [Methylophilaceae bacterium]
MNTSPIPADKSKLYLGLDFGTGGARASLIDEEGSEVFQTGVAYQDNTWQEWLVALRHLFAATPAELRGRIKSIAFCGTSSTSLLCDKSGQPLLPALLYDDNRAQAEVSRIPPDSIAANASSSLAKLLWFLERPESVAAHYFMHQADWLAFQLHGVPGISDYHNSLKLGYDIGVLAYPEWLAQADFSRLLPRVLEPGVAIGCVTPAAASTFALPPDCIVRAGTTDSIAAFFASGASTPGQAVTSLGSTMVLKLLSQTRVESPDYGIYSHRCGNFWLAGGASNCGGRVLKQLFGRERLGELSMSIDADKPTGLDYYPLPAPGERFPVNDPALLPRLTPRPESDTEYLQGLLESLARIEAQGYRLLEQFGATLLREVFTAGGGASNEAWTAIRARQLSLPVCSAKHTEAAYGAARLAKSGEKLLYSTS